MTFGQVKSIIEKSLFESYKNEYEFKKSIKEFKHNVLSDKSISKLYSLYDQLSSPQGLTESEAKIYLEEGVSLVQKILSEIKLPKSNYENLQNDYEDIDTLVYTNNISISERVESRKKILSILCTTKTINEHVSLPLKSMVNIANQTISSYLNNLDESVKKDLINILSEDVEKLKLKFEIVKEDTVSKLLNLLNQEDDEETKIKLKETIDKVEVEEFSQINYLKLRNLLQSI